MSEPTAKPLTPTEMEETFSRIDAAFEAIYATLARLEATMKAPRYRTKKRNAQREAGAVAPRLHADVGSEDQTSPSGSRPDSKLTGSRPCLMGSPEHTAARQQRGDAASSLSANAGVEGRKPAPERNA